METHSLTTTSLLHRMGLLRHSLKSRGFQGLGVLAFTAIALATPAVSAKDLAGWTYDPATQQLEIIAKAGIQPKYFVMAQPARIVLDLPDTEMGGVKLKETFTGAVRQVRVSQFQPGVTRVVLELSPDVELAPEQVKLEAKGDRWVLRPLLAKSSVAALEPTPPSKNPTQPSAPVTSSTREAAPLPLAMGADISPVTSEPPLPEPISAPPQMATPPAVAVPPLAVLPPPQTVPASRPAPPTTPSLPPLAQLPPEATTPLPPETDLPSSGLLIQGSNPVTISVPPPISLPSTSPEIVLQAPQGKVTPPPVKSPPAAVAPVLSPLEIPSTARSLPPAPPPQITVPTLQPLTPAVAPTGVTPTITPPPPMAVPPLPPVTIPTTPVPPLKPPVSSVITTSGSPTAGQVWTQQVAPGSLPISSPPTPVAPPTTPAPVKMSPPNSWVLQSSGLPQPTAVNVPASAIVSPPAIPSQPPPASPAKVIPPPNSWVMQSSGLSQPTVTQTWQPPVSGVIQPTTVPQPAISSPSIPASSVMQPTIMPATVSPAGVSPAVSVPPLQPTPMGAAPTISVPPLQPTTTQPTAQPTMMPNPVNNPGVVEFGKPLPTQGAASLNTMPMGLPTTIATNSTGGMPPSSFGQPSGPVQSTNPAIALQVGTMLTLSYPGTTEVQLDQAPQQAMMVLQTEVRDAAGNVVFPQGSYVMGQFETSRGGSKFVTSSIQRGDRIVPFFAESDPLSGNREISAASMAMYSGAGALAGGLVSKFSGWGLLLGGAAGAATNYFTAPKPAVLQPGQVVPVRMIRDVPY